MEKSFSFYYTQQAALIRLQLIQNAAARVLTRTNSGVHISPILASLHWLSVTSRITYKALNSQDLSYVTQLIVLTRLPPLDPCALVTVGSQS